MSTYLLDVNVLIALFDPAHLEHQSAHKWFASKGQKSWATCPITENGFIRVISSPVYPSADLLPNQAISLLSRFISASKQHVFWSDHVSLADQAIFKTDQIRGHKQITDIYLLGLAKSYSGKLATFDKSIPLSTIADGGEKFVEIIKS